MKVSNAKFKKTTMIGTIGLGRWLTTDQDRSDRMLVIRLEVDRDIAMVLIQKTRDTRIIGVPITDFDYLEFAGDPVVADRAKRAA